ncbi:MAG: quinone-dependent dihydroorotate dehydrogenase [Verrucomicrobiae bacterium]|nr:quinone-dependent dihydroorotate dehydrogenase [Verrucomicrobiae bacterium]
MSVLWKSLRPLAFQLPPETAHDVAFAGLGAAQALPPLLRALAGRFRVEASSLRVRAFGLDFPTPVGLAAGFDKDARLLPLWHALGFGFVEVGTVTPLPQAGNPRPRLFRFVKQEALINRMGFNNGGAAALRARLLRLRERGRRPAFPIGINLGKNRLTPMPHAVADYMALYDTLKDLGDYFVINVSSPNTPGLRQLQEGTRLAEILDRLQQRNQGRRPLLLKVAPDLEDHQLDAAVAQCLDHRLAGIVATNTTTSREGIPADAPRRTEEGGMSGRPLRVRALDVVRRIHRAAGNRLAIVGVGGIANAEDAWECLRAGATLVQIYTAFVYEGPAAARNLAAGLRDRLAAEGFSSISAAVGGEN